MKPDNRVREVMGNNLLWILEKKEGKSPSPRAEVTAVHRTQKNLVMTIIKATVTESIEQQYRIDDYFSNGSEAFTKYSQHADRQVHPSPSRSARQGVFALFFGTWKPRLRSVSCHVT